MIAFVRCRCVIYQAQSLKEKRSVVKSLTSRIKQRLNISVAELDFHHVWQRTEIGIAVVAVDRKRAEQEVHKALRIIEHDERIEITETFFEWL